MQCATRPRITELNPHLLCVLCEGYLIDATAITECLHAFCKKCIVQYLETKKYCPVCDVLVHKTKPLQNLKPDKILQSIVYKSVPDLYENEMCNRRKFYSNIHPMQHPPNPELRGEITEASDFYTSNDTISLSLEYINFLGDQNYFYVASSSKRYLRCDAAVTIKHLQKLVSAKYGLAVKHEIRFFFNGIQLPEHLTLLDIAYISSWKRNGFIRLLYQILEVRKTVIKLEKKETTTTTTTTSTPTAVNNQDDKVDKLPLDVNNCVNNTSEQAKESKLSTSSMTTISAAVAIIAPTTTVCAAIGIKSDESNVKNMPNQRNPSPVPASPSTKVNNNTPAVTTATSISTTSTSLINCKSNEKSVLNKIVEKLEKKASTGNSANATTAAIVKLADKPDQSPIADKNNKENTEKTPPRVEKSVEKSDVPVTGVSIAAQQTVTTATLKKKSQQDSPVPTKIPKLLNCDILKSTKGDICKEVESINTPIMSVNSTASVTSGGLKFIPSNPLVATYNYTTPSTKSTPPVPALHKLPTFYPAARSNSSEPGKPIKFPATTTTAIKKSISVTGSNIISRPWSYSTTSTAVAQVKPTTISNVVNSTKEQKPIKFHKTRRNVPRFLGSPHSGITPLYGGNSSGGMSTVDGKVNPTNESGAKKPQKSMVLKVDPQTLAPITSSSSSSKSASSASVTTNKKPFYMSPKMFPSIGDYSCSVTNTANYVGNLSAAAAAAAAAKLSSSAAAFNASYANMTHNPLLSTINPYLCGMYMPPFSPTPSDSAVNGPTSLDYIKAMTSFHPSCSPNLNSLYNPQHQHKFKPDKLKNPCKPTSSPPAIQRIPPTSKTPTTSEAATVSDVSKLSPVPSTISNGVYKNKNKKEISSFAINNLIPIDEGKNTTTHSCSADGINQVCDQVSSGSDPPSNKIGKQVDGRGKGDKMKCKEESIGTNGEKNASN